MQPVCHGCVAWQALDISARNPLALILITRQCNTMHTCLLKHGFFIFRAAPKHRLRKDRRGEDKPTSATVYHCKKEQSSCALARSLWPRNAKVVQIKLQSKVQGKDSNWSKPLPDLKKKKAHPNIALWLRRKLGSLKLCKWMDIPPGTEFKPMTTAVSLPAEPARKLAACKLTYSSKWWTVAGPMFRIIPKLEASALPRKKSSPISQTAKKSEEF